MDIILRDALRLKNRVIQKKQHCMELIKSENSKLVGGKRKCNVTDTFCEYEELVNLLADLKSAISSANLPIRRDLEMMSETKSMIKDLRSVPTDEGFTEDVRRFGGGEPQERTVEISQETIDKLISVAEQDLDKIQKIIGEHNSITKIKLEISPKLKDKAWIASVIS